MARQRDSQLEYLCAASTINSQAGDKREPLFLDEGYPFLVPWHLSVSLIWDERMLSQKQINEIGSRDIPYFNIVRLKRIPSECEYTVNL